MPHDHETRLVRLETQFARFVSDVESEKETRKRASEHLDKRLSTIERQVYIGMGALLAAQFLIGLFLAIWLKK